jgi:hypothetical protein
MRPDLLRVGAGERASMESLAALIGRSPRATKRFVNSYRLLKVALVAQHPDEWQRGSEATGTSAGPMFLLAVVIGLPTLAAEFVRMLPENSAAAAVDQLSALAGWAESDREHVDAVRRIRDFVASESSAEWRPLRGSDLLRWITSVSQFSFEDLQPVGGKA